MRIGGTESMLIDIVNHQINKAHVSLIIVNNEVHEPLLNKLHKLVNVYRLNRKPGSKSLVPILKLNLNILKNRYDIIHCHNHNMVGLLFPNLRKKSVLTIHTINIKSDYFKKYQMRYSISIAVQEDLKKRLGVDSIVIPNGVNFNTVTTQKRIITKDFRIVQVSRLEIHTKGQNIAINAIKHLINKGISNLNLDFIGEGPSLEQLKEQVTNLCLESHIQFLGLKDREYIYKSLKNYDLLIQPSFYEGFGLTIVEGMAAKIPVIVSDIDGPLEVIDNGKYGLFFQRGDSLALATKIEEVMLMNPSDLKVMTENSYQYAKQNFSIQNTAEQYLNEYRRY